MTEPPPTCAQPASDPQRGSSPAYARATPATLSLGRTPRRRSPSSARQPAGSSSGSSSSGGSSGRSPGGGGGGGRARAMAGAGSGSRAGPRRAAPAGLRAPGEGSASRAPRNARVRSQEIRARRRCDPGGRLRDPGGGRAWRCWGMQAGRTRGNLDGPVQEDPGRWRARSRRTPGGGPGREGASGGSSGAQLSGGLPRARLGSGAPGARAVRGRSRVLAAPLTYSLLLSPAPALPLWARGAGPTSCLSAPWPRP